MCDPNPNPVDGKWYTLAEAQVRQEQLVKTMPTGTNWHWENRSGNAVVFTYGRKRTKKYGRADNE